VTASLIKVKSCSASLRMLLVCMRNYRKSILRYNFLILDTYHPNTLCLSEQRCGGSVVIFQSQKGSASKSFGKHCRKEIFGQ